MRVKCKHALDHTSYCFRTFTPEMFRDLAQCFVLRFRQLEIHVRQADKAKGAEQNERVVETGRCLEI